MTQPSWTRRSERWWPGIERRRSTPATPSTTNIHSTNPTNGATWPRFGGRQPHRERSANEGGVWWCELPETSRRPVVVLSRDAAIPRLCLLYTSDAADDLTRVDLGGRRIIQ